MNEEYDFSHPAFSNVLLGGAPLEEAELIVIGFHGRGGGEQRIFDSMAKAYTGYDNVTYLAPASSTEYWWKERLNTDPYAPDLLLAMDGVSALIADLEAKGFSSKQISLTGISQGSSFAAEYVAREDPDIHSTVLMSGALPGLFYSTEDQAEVYSQDLSGQIVRMSWNSGDVIMPLSLMQQTGDLFNSRGAEVDLRVHPGGSHNITKGDRDVLASITNIARGTDGNDNLTGTANDDLIYGFAGNDVIAGLDGKDVLIGGDGNDVLRGFNDNDRLWGGDQNDKLYGGDGDDILYGEQGKDELVGNDGNDVLYGQDGDDNLKGGKGDDFLLGGSGINTLSGEQGADTFVFDFHGSTSVNKITDFQTGIDKLLISGVDESAYNEIDYSFNSDGHVKIEFGKTIIIVDDPITMNDGMMIIAPDILL